jgi:hypothetical protein
MAIQMRPRKAPRAAPVTWDDARFAGKLTVYEFHLLRISSPGWARLCNAADSAP